MKGGLGLVPGALLNIDLKPGASPFYLRPYPVPQLDRMIHFGILEPALHSPWASPSFAIKKKNGSVRIVTDFRKLNSMIVRHPYPLPKLLDIFARVDGFTHATALDLSMGFYHIPLSPSAQQLCTTVLPWGKYRYKRMPMGLSISPDVFQHRMDQLLGDLKFVICWIDDIYIFSQGSFELHFSHLEQVFQCLREANLQINVLKSSFLAKELTYLGFIFSSKGIHV